MNPSSNGVAPVGASNGVPSSNGSPAPVGASNGVPSPNGSTAPVGASIAVPSPNGGPAPVGASNAVPSPHGSPAPAGASNAVPSPNGSPSSSDTASSNSSASSTIVDFETLEGTVNVLYHDDNYVAAVQAFKDGLWEEAKTYSELVLANPLLAQNPTDSKYYLTRYLLCYSLLEQASLLDDATALPLFQYSANEARTVYDLVRDTENHILINKMWMFWTKAKYNIRRITAAENDNEFEFPEYFLCPIYRVAFRDPVITPWGNTFERQAIVEHLGWGNAFDPGPNGGPLVEGQLVPNKAVKEAVEWFMEKHGWAYKFAYDPVD